MNVACRSSPSRYTNLPSSLPGYPRPSLALIPYSERTTSLGSGQENCRELPIILNKLANGLRLSLQPPPRELKGNPFSRAVVRNPVFPCPGARGRRRNILLRAPVHQTQHTHSHARGRGGTTRGSSATQPPVVFRPYPPMGGWGRLGASSRPQIRRWDRRRCCRRISGPPTGGQKSVGFCPLGGAHQSAWSLYIMLGYTLRRRCPAGA
jgi:hypothetical protein